MSPLTAKGQKIMNAMMQTYGKTGKTAKDIQSIFYATVNKRKIPGVEPRGFAQLRPKGR